MTVTSYDPVSICSAALVGLGEDPINSIENPVTPIEFTCATLFPLELNSLLSMHEWNFANPTRQLAVDANATDDQKAGYLYAHRFPSNMLVGPTAVYDSATRRRPIHDFMVSGDYLLSDCPVIYIRFRAKPDFSIMPMYFINLLVTSLEMRMAKPIADNTGLAQEKRILAYGPADLNGDGGLYAQAKKLDSVTQPMRSLFQNGDPLTSTRY